MTPCWIFRHEALGYADAWWQAPVPDDLPCACDDSDGYHTCVYEYLHAMCVREEGHTGDHTFVRQSEVTLVFTPNVVAVAHVG